VDLTSGQDLILFIDGAQAARLFPTGMLQVPRDAEQRKSIQAALREMLRELEALR
jgi:hypothetical protein